MTTLHFTKGHGTGNDFVLFADPDGQIDLTPDQIAAIADRHFGVGGDGVIRAVKSRNLADGSEALAEDDGAEWFMDYYNADGSVAEMCGNGIRVFARFLFDNGLAELADGDTMAIGTRAGVRDLQRNRTGFQVDLGRWSLLVEASRSCARRTCRWLVRVSASAWATRTWWWHSRAMTSWRARI